MLKEMFESTFYVVFPAKSDVIVALQEREYDKDFSLFDPKSCLDCHSVCNDIESRRKQLLVVTHSHVHVISLDEVFGYVKEDLGETCDYMLDGGQQVVLVEMTCCLPDHIKNKRQKARRQLFNSLCILNTHPEIKKHIEEKTARYVVFSWKKTEPDKDANKDSVEGNMMAMMGMADEVYSPDNISKFEFDFKLKEIRYPDSLVWNVV